MTKTRTLEERFWQKVERRGDQECWPWTASCDGYGYGMIGVSTHGTKRAHVVSYEIENGPVPAGLFIRHKCDNPICVNPAHLEPGTPLDNMLDMAQRGRSRKGRSRLSDEQKDQIRASALGLRALGAAFGISRNLAWRVRTGRS